MIASVHLCDNGMVIVQDLHGRQLPDYQGRLADVQEMILRDAPSTAVFYFGVWGRRHLRIRRETWGCLRYDHDMLDALAAEHGTPY